MRKEFTSNLNRAELNYCFFVFFLQAPDPNESANFHYVAFIEKDGCLFELGTIHSCLLGQVIIIVRKIMKNT